MSQHGDGLGRQLARVEHTGGDGVLNVVVQKRNVVGTAHNAASGVRAHAPDVWVTMPLRTSQVRSRPWPSRSK